MKRNDGGGEQGGGTGGGDISSDISTDKQQRGGGEGDIKWSRLAGQLISKHLTTLKRSKKKIRKEMMER